MTVIRSPISPVIFSPLREPTALYKGGGASFDPAAFLAAYPTARWWSPRQLEQADASAISQVNDLSANANHLVQATGTAQPTYTITGGIGRAVLDSGDHMQLAAGAALAIGTVTKLTSVAAIRHTNSSAGVLCEAGVPLGVNGGWGVYINNGAAGKIGAGVGTGNGSSNTGYNYRDLSGAGAVPRSYVVALTIDTTQAAADEIALMVDGIAQPSVSAAVSGTVSGAIPVGMTFSVGRRAGGGVPFISQLFDLIIIPGDRDDADIVALSQHLFHECGF